MKIVEKLKNAKFSAKISLIIIAVCIVVLTGNYFILQNSHQAYDELLYQNTAQLITSIADQLEMQFSKIDMMTLAITNNGWVQETLQTMSTEEEGSKAWLNAKRRLASDLHNYMYGIEYFYGSVIVTAEDNVVGSADSVCPSNTMDKLLSKAKDANGLSCVVCQDNNVYYLRQIINQDSVDNELLGVMIARVNIQKLVRDCETIYNQTNIGLDISVIAEDSLIYSSDHQHVEKLETDGWQIRDDHFVVQCTNDLGWKFLFCSNYDKIRNAIEQAELRSMCLSAIVTVIALLFCWRLMKRFAVHLEILMKKIDAYGKGVLPSADEMAKYKDRQDEFGRLHRKFDQMAYDYKELSEVHYERLIQEKDTQYKLLQQQIQPHFIYNTLALISGIAYEHEDNEIASITISLSQFVRASMNINKKTVTLRDELALIDDYMHIQMKRFGSRLQYRSAVPEEMMNILLPKFTVQPIVENAIKYAMAEMLDTCYVNVRGYVEDDTAVIVVEDNGPGIDPNILQKLETKEVSAKGDGIGLQNIQKRIQLLFSKEYGLRVFRKDGMTQIHIRIPYQQDIPMKDILNQEQ